MRSKRDVLEVFIFWGRIKDQVYASYSNSSAQALRLCPPALYRENGHQGVLREYPQTVYCNSRSERHRPSAPKEWDSQPSCPIRTSSVIFLPNQKIRTKHTYTERQVKDYLVRVKVLRVVAKARDESKVRIRGFPEAVRHQRTPRVEFGWNRGVSMGPEPDLCQSI